MPTARDDEPTETEAKERMRAWLIDYMARTDEKQVQVAERLGVSEPTISNIKKGVVLPGFKMLIRMHFRLGAPLHEVLRFKKGARASDNAGPAQTKVLARK